MAYPSSHVPAGGGVYNPVSGVTATYGRNALGQLFNLSIAGQTVVSSAYYNAAGQQQQMTWDGWTEDHWFNNAGQMWKQQIKNSSNTVIGGWEYYFPVTGNNGRITGTKDLQSLEEITYQYDALNRLTNAAKTGGGWSEPYAYDGFGNLNQKGASSWQIDTSTNRLHSSTGATYDSNGNLTGLLGGISYTYDAANRMSTATITGGLERYAYTADNRRVWKHKPGWGEEITFWGVSGRLSTYRLDTVGGTYQLYFVEQTRNVWFGAKLIRTGPGATPTKLATDRLGSVRMRQTGNNPIEYLTYAPYGELRSGPNGEGEKFATYYRDQTGLDYADQRYYSSAWGRFGTVDRARDGSNWYAYSNQDPANISDPTGQAGCVVVDSTAADPSGVCPPGTFYFAVSNPILVSAPVSPNEWPAPHNPHHPAEAWAGFMLSSESCRDLFFHGEEAVITPLVTYLPPVGGYDPRAVLHDVLTNSHYYDPYFPLRAEVTRPTEGGHAEVETNYSTGVTTLRLDPEWFSANASSVPDIFSLQDRLDQRGLGNATPFVYQGMTLIHELGHIYNMYGGYFPIFGGSRIEPDGKRGLPNAGFRNRARVYNACAVPQFGGYPIPISDRPIR